MLPPILPNPGSLAALAMGCICTSLDNDRKDCKYWAIQPDCRLHGVSAERRFFVQHTEKKRELPEKQDA